MTNTATKITAKGILDVFRNAAQSFGRDGVIRMSASLAYFTIVTIAPMIIVVLFLTGIFLGNSEAEASLINQVRRLMGGQAAEQVQQIITNATVDTDGILASVLGFALLFIGASTVFSDMQVSLNRIWQLRAKSDRGWLKMLVTRLVSFAMVASLGFVLLVSLVVSTLLDMLKNRMSDMLNESAVYIAYGVNALVSFAVVTFLFAFVFKVLPDARIRWRDVLPGAVVTALLFTAMRFAIAFFFGRTDIAGMYGAAGSLVLLLIWIFVSATVLYFGAELTKAYTIKYGAEVIPNRYAVTVRTMTHESGKRSVQENDAEEKNNEAQRNNNDASE